MLQYKKLSMLGAILCISFTLQSMQRNRINNTVYKSILNQKEESAIKDLWWQSIASCFGGLSCYFGKVYSSDLSNSTFGETAEIYCCYCATACFIGNACISCLAACHRQKKLRESLKKMHDLERAE